MPEDKKWKESCRRWAGGRAVLSSRFEGAKGHATRGVTKWR